MHLILRTAQKTLADDSFAGNEIQADGAEYQKAILSKAQADIGLPRQNGRRQRCDVVDRETDEVRINQHQDVVLRPGEAGCHRKALPSIHRGGDELDRRETFDNLGGVVRRAIVHHDDLVKQWMHGNDVKYGGDSRRLVESADNAGDSAGDRRRGTTEHEVPQV